MRIEMFLLLSGEGASDIGTQDDKIGPMTKFIDKCIARHSRYSLIEVGSYTIVTKQTLSETAKTEIKPLSKKGKKQLSETRYFYQNARALALLAKRKGEELHLTVIPVLFRDADGTASSNRGEWRDKRQSMLDGFEVAGVLNGIPMIPKPKSEAWILCALRDDYQNCERLEDQSGNDASPNSLKEQLDQHLGEAATRMLLNEKVDRGQLDITRIVDMPSLNVFKDRVDEVFSNLPNSSNTT